MTKGPRVRLDLDRPSADPDLPDPALDPADLPSAYASRWLSRYRRVLLALDATALLLAAFTAVQVRFGETAGSVHGVSYYLVAALLVAGWLGVLALSRCYEARFVGVGTEEFRRVANGSVRLAAAVAFTSYAFRLDVARGFVAVVLPLGLTLLVLGRFGARQWLYRVRRQGRCSHRTVVVGGAAAVGELVRQLRTDPLAGLRVVGVCVPGGAVSGEVAGAPVLGPLSTLTSQLAAVQADTVAVVPSPAIGGEGLRRLSYELEGSEVDLLVAPALTNISGSRISIRPVAGLPLLHLEEPEISGGRQLLKATFDKVVGGLLLLVALPVLLGCALAVRLTSRGPVLFRQTRVGRDGRHFALWKLRSMYADAAQRRAALEASNEHDGVLFKMRTDPRVTPVGRFLRRFSLDELPQLANVLRGHMSLVGPRPPLPSEVARYERDTRRRLLVKPGMTGLWQISGRADLPWADAVRLDLQYVESWSLGMDLAVLGKTVAAVAKGRGAY